MFSVFQHLPGLGPSSLCPPASFVLLGILLQECEKAYRRAARTGVIIKIVSDLQDLVMEPFPLCCFGMLGPWKCLHGRGEGDWDGCLKICSWAAACRT